VVSHEAVHGHDAARTPGAAGIEHATVADGRGTSASPAEVPPVTAHPVKETQAPTSGGPAASEVAGGDFPPGDVPLPRVGGGMDKSYHWSADFPKWGWLETSQDVRTRELNANATIRREIPEARVPETRAEPTPFLSRGGSSSPAQCGYWTENIDIRYSPGKGRAPEPVSIKPQMMALAVSPKFRTICRALAADEDGQARLAMLRNDLLQLNGAMEKVASKVGEVTFGVDRRTGRVFLLDLAPGHSGETASQQLETIVKGIENMIAEVGTFIT
jgi:hypothetical protein